LASSKLPAYVADAHNAANVYAGVWLKKTMTILEGRGLFWWADDPIPAQQIAPNSSASGLLKIDNDGSSSLELDSYLPSEHGPMSAIVQRELPADKCIRGLLKGSGQHILLIGLIRNGGQMRSNGTSYERYIAFNCLVSESGPVAAKLIFKYLIVPLSGYEEWLRLGAIKVVRTRRTVSAKYKWPKKASYHFADGSLTINFELDGQSSGAIFGTEVSMKETASASLRFTKPRDLEGIKTQYQLFEDLLILLTSTDYALDWPSVSLTKKSRCRLYFRKLGDRTVGTAPRYFECVTNFAQLRDSFGLIWEAWRSKREELGPGLYLYLGTRRGIRLYVEHRFVNLVWGIEAFHRRKYTVSPTAPLKKKVDRILEQISEKKDKKWLAKKLENAHEPSLGERIFETISAVPLGLDATRLRTFSDACAKLRNDISHFGGQRHNGGSYDDFGIELNDRNEALATLYQMLLLHEIGINKDILKWWVFEGFRSYPIKVHLAKVGLLDKSAVDLKPPEQ
jgi:ApeA-like protein/HEPN superfamily Apea-like protein